MEFKVIPFHPTVTDTGGAAQAAQELQVILNNQLSQGWRFKCLESMKTDVKPTGCASFKEKERVERIQLLVFERIN
jgi:hypothetical protein